MTKLCNQCNTELNGANAAKKDARRFRKICKACYSVKRNAYRDIKKDEQKEHLKTLIDQQILRIDFEALINVKPRKDTVKSNIFLWLKNKIQRIKNALYS